LVSAPAGFGKTTLVQAWCTSPPAMDRALAWLSIDTTDNDPVRFWTCVLAALRRSFPAAGEQTLAGLRNVHPL
jgi:LuxR family maltose regulon positive regulatory protein